MRNSLWIALIFMGLHAGVMQAQARVVLPATFLEGWDELVDEYFRVKDALVAENTWGAAMAAGRMLLTLDGMSTKDLSPTELRDWLMLRAALRSPADQIAGASGIIVQRTYFQPLSDAMRAGVRHIGAGEFHIYVQHCPMADAGRGADWLSRHAEVQNPYFGVAMLHCGKVLAQVPGAAAAPVLQGGELPGRLLTPVMHGCHGAGR